LWTILTWLLGFASVLVGFVLSQGLITLNAISISLNQPLYLLVLSLIGIALTLYSAALIQDYGMHIKRNWARAEGLVEVIQPLQDILDSGKDNISDKGSKQQNSILENLKSLNILLKVSGSSLPQFCEHLLLFTSLFFMVFIIFLLLAIISSIALVVSTVTLRMQI
jgi:hypothetical protein